MKLFAKVSSEPSRGLQARKQRACHLRLISFGSMTLLLLHELKDKGDYMTEEKYINFIANYDDWVSIKKLKIEPATQPKTVMEFLASLTTSIDSRVEVNLRKVVELEKLDSAITELDLGSKDYEGAIAAINSRAVTSVIKEITEIEELQKNERKELADFCKVYATRKVLKEIGLMVDYSGINIPGMKRVKKTKA